MKRLLLLFFGVLLYALPAQAATRASGWCEQGSTVSVTSLTTPFVLSNVQRSFPSCTITVYNAGTLTLATIYGDNIKTAKANPFTADATGLWFFYGEGRYDVRLSGGGIPTPFTLGDITMPGGEAFGYADLRAYGAICDGTTNVQSAASAAIAAGVKQLYLPANCLWNPTANTLPGGIDVYGESLLTSKIWATTPAANFLTLGPNSSLSHLNTNGQGCFGYNGGNGCPVYLAQNQDDSNSIPVQAAPYNIFMDVGHSPTSAGVGLNAITVIQRGDGGGIYAQQAGGFDSSAGSAIQADQVRSGALGQALLVSRRADGIGMLLQDLAGSEGTAHTPQPTMAFSTGIKQHGDNLSMFQGTSTWDGNGIDMNFGVGGTFTGAFVTANLNSVPRYTLNYLGNEERAGIDLLSGGAAVAAGGTITPTGQLFRVTGAGTITTINLPAGAGGKAFCLHLIPDTGSTWTTATGGNIALGSTAVVKKALQECYDPLTGLFYPAY